MYLAFQFLCLLICAWHRNLFFFCFTFFFSFLFSLFSFILFILTWGGGGTDLMVSILENGEGNGTPLQYSCLENPMDGGAWWAAVHGIAKGRTRLSDFTFTFHFHALEKEMATRSSVLAWRIPGTGEPGGLPSMGSHKVGHDWSDLAVAAWIFLSVITFLYITDFPDNSVNNLPSMQETPAQFLVRKICWRRDRPPTLVFWPGEFHVVESMGSQRVRHNWATFTSVY